MKDVKIDTRQDDILVMRAGSWRGNVAGAAMSAIRPLIDRHQVASAKPVLVEQDHGHFGVAHVGSDLRFLAVNAGLGALLHFSDEDFRQMSLADVVHPDDLPRLKTLLDGLVRGEANEFSMELQVLPKGRPAIWAICQCAAMRDDSGVFLRAILNLSEIPGYAQTLAALRDSERRHKALLSNLAGVAYRSRPDKGFKLDYVSSGCRDMFGVEPALLITGAIQPADLVHPDDFGPMREATAKALLERTMARNVFRVRHTDGSWRWVLETCRGVYAENGSLDALEGFITDIHDQKMTEERLFLSERALREAQEVAGLGSWEIDHRTGDVTWSDKTYEIFGQDRASFQPTLAAFQEVLIHPEDRDLEAANYARALEGQEPYASVHRIVRPDGEVRHIAERGETSFDERGQPLRTIGTTLDITDVKRAEKALVEEQVFKNALLETSDFAVVASDAEGRLKLFNRAAREWHGIDITATKPEEWSRHYNLYEPDGRTLLAADAVPLVQAMNGEVVRDVEIAIARPGHPLRHVLTDGAPLFDSEGRKLGAMVIMRDVTRQRQAEANLRQRDAILSAVAFAAERLLTTWDWQQEIDTILSTLGQAMHASRAYVMRNRPDDRGRIYTALAHEWCAPGIPPSYLWTSRKGFDLVAAGVGHWSERLRLGGVMQTRSRDFLPAEAALAEPDGIKGIIFLPIFVHGEWWGLLGFDDCVTDRHWSLAEQEALRAAANTIASAIERRRQQEDRLARVVAEEANQAKSAFLATMSHEIRTPMNAILGLAEILGQSTLTEDQADLLGGMRDAGRHLLTLIDDILDISKIEAGQLKILPSEVSILETVDAVVGSLSGTAADKGVQLHVFVEPELPTMIVSDGLRLRQVMYNLLGNAIKFSADLPDRAGRVELRVDAEEGEPMELRITVRDNGIGMSEEVMARVFEPFAQGDSQSTRRYGGTGLGLAITQRIIALMGGRISVFSTQGEGSTFTLNIPVEVLAQEPAVPIESPLQGVRCILHESSSYIAQDLEAYLQHAGARTFEPGSVESDEAASEPLVRICGPEVIESMWNLPAEPVVLVESGRWRRRQSVSGQIVSIESTGLSQAALVAAVALAAGRPLPETAATTDAPNAAEAPLPEPSSIAPILVAEDDPMNQKVILRQLSLLGLRAELAETGAEALAMAARREYSMLLTDLHMPDMDGCELARRLRACGETGTAGMPILALTADARQSVPEAIAEAGMNGLLIKPVTLSQLCQSLRPWLRQSVATDGAALTVSDADGEETNAQVIDIAALSARIGDDRQTQHEFLEMFLEQLGPLARQIENALAANDPDTACRLAHRLKSSSRAIGAMTLGEVSATLEAICRRGTTDMPVSLVSDFRSAHVNAARAISEILESHDHAR